MLSIKLLAFLCTWHSLEVYGMDIHMAAFSQPRPRSLQSIGIDTQHYHKSEARLLTLAKLAAQYPHLMSVYSIGDSVLGHPLLVIKITTDGEERKLEKPMFKYVGSMHGNEGVGHEILIYLVGHLLFNYGKDHRIPRRAV